MQQTLTILQQQTLSTAFPVRVIFVELGLGRLFNVTQCSVLNAAVDAL